jgi:hypothetical protein
MSSKDLIREELLRIADKWPQVRLRYQFDAFCLTHAIEVHPAYMHEADPAFRSMELQVMDKLTDAYPEEGVYFVHPGDIAGIEGEADGTIHGFWANMETEKPEFIWPSETYVVMEPVVGYGRSFTHSLLSNTVLELTQATFPFPPTEIRGRVEIELELPTGTGHLDDNCPEGSDYALAA